MKNTPFMTLSAEQKSKLLVSLRGEYDAAKAKGLSLDLSRGKPGPDILDRSMGLLMNPITREECILPDGTDVRNYGFMDGLPDMKKLFGEIFGIPAEKIIIGGNSSTQLMYDAFARAMIFGTVGSPCPWSAVDGRKWLCVVPGYDRHFRIAEEFGFELISVPMLADGPDMDYVEKLVCDEKVKGIWCVPKYSNPSGNTYSDETVRRLASMKCAAPDFRIFWDNAYAIHDLGGKGDTLADIFAACDKAGNPDRVFYFTSTSKITFPGAGVAMVAASEANLAEIRRHMTAQTIGNDKINQLRHIRFLRNADAVKKHMKELGSALATKFGIVTDALSALDGLGIADYTKPRGGYFISLNCLPGTASRVYELMKDAGVKLTPPGATFPYGKDPNDTNLRIAPSYPADSDLEVICALLVLCVKIAALEKLAEGR